MKVVTPFVSVIVPNYNHFPYLEERLNSILNQSYQNFELIILDDKSTDNSTTIINKYSSNPKVSHVILNEENSGSTFKQWKKGILLAKGEYIWIAESDDSCSKDFLQRMIKSIIENNSVLAFCQSFQMDEKSNISKKLPISSPLKRIDGKDFIKTKLVFNNYIYNASMVVFRKDAIKNEIFEQISKFKYAGDWLFFGEICKNGKISILQDYLNFFRRHSGNVTNKSVKNGLTFTEGLKVVRKLRNWNPLTNIKITRVWIYKWKKLNSEYHFSKEINSRIKLLLIKLWF